MTSFHILRLLSKQIAKTMTVTVCIEYTVLLFIEDSYDIERLGVTSMGYLLKSFQGLVQTDQRIVFIKDEYMYIIAQLSKELFTIIYPHVDINVQYAKPVVIKNVKIVVRQLRNNRLAGGTSNKDGLHISFVI